MSELEPGIHQMSNADYHGETDHLSSSVLKGFLPEHYKQGGSQDALDFGTLFHTVVLEPDDLDEYVVLDAHAIAGSNPKTGKPYDSPQMTAKFKAAALAAAEDGRIVVTQDQWDQAHRMAEAVKAHALANELIHEGAGTYEESVFAVTDAGVRHKARFDRRIPGRIIDLKSTNAKPSDYALTRAAMDYGYDLSAAHYLAVAELAGLDAEDFTLVFVTKDEPHHVMVCDLSEAFLDRGRVLRDLAVERATNPDAPRYFGASEALTLHPPGYANLAPAVETAIPADFTWSLNEYA